MNLPYFLIIAIARNGKTNEPLSLHYNQSRAYEFIYNSKAGPHEGPITNALDYDVMCINGKFQKYTFTIRAYQNSGKGLVDVDLFSSEADLMMLLKEEDIQLQHLNVQDTYRLRKMEYNLREENKERGEGNLGYHLERLKK